MRHLPLIFDARSLYVDRNRPEIVRSWRGTRRKMVFDIIVSSVVS